MENTKMSALPEGVGTEREHRFLGKWITAGEFLLLPRLNVFHRQLDSEARGRIENRVRDRHILFRREFELSDLPAQFPVMCFIHFIPVSMLLRICGKGKMCLPFTPTIRD